MSRDVSGDVGASGGSAAIIQKGGSSSANVSVFICYLLCDLYPFVFIGVT